MRNKCIFKLCFMLLISSLLNSSVFGEDNNCEDGGTYFFLVNQLEDYEFEFPDKLWGIKLPDLKKNGPEGLFASTNDLHGHKFGGKGTVLTVIGKSTKTEKKETFYIDIPPPSKEGVQGVGMYIDKGDCSLKACEVILYKIECVSTGDTRGWQVRFFKGKK